MTDMTEASSVRLEPIIGAWRTDGDVLGEDGETVVETFAGTDTYEWLGSSFVIHRVDVLMGEERVENLEIICPYDHEQGRFPTVVYDGAGGKSERSFATLDDAGVWTFRAGAGRSRAQSTLRVDGDGKRMRGAWSWTDDDGATWRPWMRLTLTRMPGSG